MYIYYQNTFSLKNNENFQNTVKRGCFSQLQNPKVPLQSLVLPTHAGWVRSIEQGFCPTFTPQSPQDWKCPGAQGSE